MIRPRWARRPSGWWWACGLLLLAQACARDSPERIVIGLTTDGPGTLGVRLAIDDINRSGGVGGVPLSLETSEAIAAGSTAELVDWASRLVRDEDLVAVVGSANSDSTLAVTPLYDQAAVPHLVTSATNPAITKGEWTYRLCLSDARQGELLGRYAVETWDRQEIVMVYVNDAYGRGLAEVFERTVERAGGRVVGHIFHREPLRPIDRELIRRELAELTTDPPDLLALFHRPESASWTLGILAELDLDLPMLGGEDLSRQPMVRSAAVESSLRAARFYVPAVDRQEPFFSQYLERFGSAPVGEEVFAYDAVQLLRRAMVQEGPTREGIRRYLERAISQRKTLEGVGGEWRFDPSHDADRPLHIVEWQADGWQPLRRLIPP